MPTFVFTWLPLLPLVGWLLTMGFSPASTEGEPLFSVPLPLLARMKMFALPFLLGLGILVLLAFFADTGWVSLVLLVGAFAVVLCVPVSYKLTSRGIRTGRGPFRRWTEFAGVRRSRRGALLVGSQRTPNYPIYLSGSRGDDEFVHTLKNLILQSYKGKSTDRSRLQRDRVG